MPLKEEVGMTGLEPAASTSRTWRANQLRYIPLSKNYKPGDQALLTRYK